MTELLNAKLLEIRRPIKVKNGCTFYVTLPKEYCKRIGLTGKDGEEITFIVHEIWRDNKILTLTTVLYK